MQLKDLEEFPDDAYLMVSQLAWEEDVIWNGDDIKHKVGGAIGALLAGTWALLIKCVAFMEPSFWHLSVCEI